MGDLGIGEQLIFWLALAAVSGVSIWAIIRATKSGRIGWAVAIGVTLIVTPVSLILAVVYLTAVHPKANK